MLAARWRTDPCDQLDRTRERRRGRAGGRALKLLQVLPPPATEAMRTRLVEVVGHYGTWHLGKLHIGMSRALQLAQCSTVRITTAAPLPMQVDGEPWMQEEDCTVTIEHHSQALMLRRSRGEGSGAVMGVVSSVLAQAAAERFITTEQHRALVTEIARRLP